MRRTHRNRESGCKFVNQLRPLSRLRFRPIMTLDSLLLAPVGSCAHRVKARKTSSPSLLPGDHLLYPPSHDANLCCPRNPCSDVPTAISPCGICRQTLLEFCHLDMPVFLVPAVYPQTPQKGAEGTEEEDSRGLGVNRAGWSRRQLGGYRRLDFAPEVLERPRL